MVSSVYHAGMGTEIFPVIMKFMKFVVGTVGVIATAVAIYYAVIYFRSKKKPTAQQAAREVIVNALISIVIVLIAYIFLSGIGPAFRLIF